MVLKLANLFVCPVTRYNFCVCVCVCVFQARQKQSEICALILLTRDVAGTSHMAVNIGMFWTVGCLVVNQ